jgi:uncharacterized membrane protein
LLGLTDIRAHPIGEHTVTFTNVVDHVGTVVDGAGVTIIAVGAVLATVVAIARLVGREPEVYRRYRQQLGRTILLGLELLVAADIVRTVAVTPTIRSVSVLGVIVLIRTFLSFSLELEITGRWPWQKAPPPS